MYCSYKKVTGCLVLSVLPRDMAMDLKFFMFYLRLYGTRTNATFHILAKLGN